MPTGYTAAIAKDISFEQFVWNCARGMGALIMMRDDPSDAPAPDRFEPSTYNADALAKAQKRMAELSAMTSDECNAAAAAAYKDACEKHDAHAKEKAELRAKYEAMLAKVRTWVPPSVDHEGLKNFMASQISESIPFDCSMKYYDEPKRLTGAEWHESEVKSAMHDIGYHGAESAKEIERTESRNRWVAQLRASVPQPATLKP